MKPTQIFLPIYFTCLITVLSVYFCKAQRDSSFYLIANVSRIKDSIRIVRYSGEMTIKDSSNNVSNSVFDVIQVLTTGSDYWKFRIEGTSGDLNKLVCIFNGESTVIFKIDSDAMIKIPGAIPNFDIVPIFNTSLETPFSWYNSTIKYDSMAIVNGSIRPHCDTSISKIVMVETHIVGDDSILIERKYYFSILSNIPIGYEYTYLTKNGKFLQSLGMNLSHIAFNNEMDRNLITIDESKYKIEIVNTKE